MFVDAEELAGNESIHADVCIVGTGPAGIMLARSLRGRGLSVCVLESGRPAGSDDRTRSLATVSGQGDFEQVKPDQRNREFGGNAGFWGVQVPGTTHGVRLTPFQASDFDRREAIPHSGWPISRSDLEPYYARAQALLGAGPYSYDTERWTSADAPALPLERDGVQTTMFLFGNGELFTGPYRKELESDPSITVYLSANAVELITDDSGETVRSVRAATVTGKSFTVSARMTVLAAGGVESTQLLLVSNKVHQNGLGNTHDLVGRFFMDHPIAEGGVIVPHDRRLFDLTALYDKRVVDGVSVMGGLTLSDRIVRERQLLNLTSWLFPRPLWYARPQALDAFRRLSRGSSLARGPRGLWTDVRTVVDGAGAIADSLYGKLRGVGAPLWPTLADGGWSTRQQNRARAYGVFEVLHLLEQAPDPDNRLTLGSELDALGRRKIQLRSRWRDADQDGVDTAQAILDQALQKAGIGRFVRTRREDGQMVFSSLGASHHMGTTRMSASARTGVVDEQCRVHGIKNLYIASSSVFPTGSSLNPTLTICAIASRVAEQVALRLSRDVVVAA